MQTVGDLADELRCTVNEIQRAGRELGIAAKSPGYRLDSDDYKALRDRVTAMQAEAARNRVVVDAPVAAPKLMLDDRFVPVRDRVGHVKGATALRLRLHEDFAAWLWSDQTDSRLKRRTNLVLRQLAAFGRTSIVKS